MAFAITCPLCRHRIADLSERCPSCGGDLAALAGLVDLADRHFNDAVRAARVGRWNTSAEHLAVTLALNPADAEARQLLTKVRYHQDPKTLPNRLWHKARIRLPYGERLPAQLPREAELRRFLDNAARRLAARRSTGRVP
ncbi:hypothetical protein [Streptomyces sp. SID3343]|uniref:hypothetical protein n=1 Tax=Streptomyces sp. SID3343 TaxID=2690260 RepID=UPI00136E3485|nr:hypothetical protein [Streptomyces sp. SID3343]MYW02930.1 hypothetical protein [Streptomyces sp. SID3343]